jgi:hypothetical protein
MEEGFHLNSFTNFNFSNLLDISEPLPTLLTASPSISRIALWPKIQRQHKMMTRSSIIKVKLKHHVARPFYLLPIAISSSSKGIKRHESQPFFSPAPNLPSLPQLSLDFLNIHLEKNNILPPPHFFS